MKRTLAAIAILLMLTACGNLTVPCGRDANAYRVAANCVYSNPANPYHYPGVR